MLSVNQVNKMNGINIYVAQGDITQIRADALMTAINSGGAWFGGIDSAIRRVAGNLYHSQAAKKAPLHDLDTIIAKRGLQRHNGKFKDVVFVVDDLKTPLDLVVNKGLHAANNEYYTDVLIPAVRTGVMLGVYEKTLEETTGHIAAGVYGYSIAEENNHLQNIAFVVYNDQNVADRLTASLNAY